jgi:hypothetical protein
VVGLAEVVEDSVEVDWEEAGSAEGTLDLVAVDLVVAVGGLVGVG